MTEIVYLAVYDMLADWETGAAIAHLNNPEYQRTPGRFEVRTVGLTIDPITTAGGVRIVPDVALCDVTPEGSAILILPGANTWEGDELVPFAAKAREFVDAGVPVAAICGATFGLAKAGLLDDRDHTSNADEYLAVTGYAGADRYVDAPAVTGDNVITANAMSPFEFAREIFARLDVYEPAVLDAWFKLFARKDPTGYYAMRG